MTKKILSLMVLLLTIVAPAAFAQQGPTPMPLKQGVKSGVLPNGLHYYVLHNTEPKNRANFYIAQKVGSTLETPEQLGLAHFLEHMAFNGTKTFPGKNLLNYLQSKGIRFGADINAYTSFDETVYNINNVPSNDIALMDSCLLALRDWSCDILLEETEIEAERGVIHEEWRTRNDAGTRMYTKILPELFEEYQYEQMPIGSMDVVMNFKPQALRDYYHKWYRPDQQGIIVVGDFDADVMEKKVVELFSSIPMPPNPAERTYPHVSDNVEPIYVTFEDAELRGTQITVSFKYDRTPFELRNTVEAYLQDVLAEGVISTLINNRLQEYAENPNCNYAYAQCYFGNYYVAKNKGTFGVMMVAKGDPEAAFNDAMSIVARACKTGFTDSELERADSQILSSYERAAKEIDKTDSEALGQELIRHFIDNEPAPGADVEYQIASMALPTLSAPVVNEICKALLTPENQVIVFARPKMDSPMPAKETMTQALNNIINADYEAYVDEVITDPLIEKMPKPGKIKKVSENALYGSTELMLSNGVKVVVKPTDFAADEVKMTMFRMGGKNAYAASQAADILLLEDAYEQSNFGKFDATKLRKYLAGKQVALGLTLGIATTSFEGRSTVKDLPTLFELLYTSFTNMQPNPEQYKTIIDRARPMLERVDSDPRMVFQKEVNKATWNNPVMAPVGVAQLDAANYEAMFKILKDAAANAADYTLLLVGNVDVETLRPLLETYIASLPSKGKKSKVEVLNNIAIATGDVNAHKWIIMETPAVNVYENYSGSNLDYDMKNDVLLDILADVLQNNFTTTLREEEGGTYGASVSAQLLPASHQWMLNYTFQTNEEMATKLMVRANKEAMELLKNGTTAEEFSKVREAAISQLDNALRTNDYWTSVLLANERGFDIFKDRREFLQNLTLDYFNSYIRGIYDGKNRIQVVLNGKAAE